MYDKKRISVVNFLVLAVLVCNLVGNEEFAWSYEVRCVEREREALLKFKKGLKINNSSLLSSWGSEDDKKECCRWKGIRCGNTTGHVIVLLLQGNRSSGGYSLGGEISSALLELHHLKVLDLSYNDFGSNRIPEFIFSMTQLQRLNLSACNFSGIIPPHIGNLTNMKTLDLSWNDLSDIPQSIGFMNKLEVLHLRGSISGVIPPHVGNLTNLQTLDLSYNDFGKSKIPESIGSMKKLEHLNTYFSNFAGIVPHQLWNLTNLKTLDLSSNQFIENKIPKFIGSMKKLEELNLGRSNLSGIVPRQLGNLTNLQTLDLSYNFDLIIENLNWLDSHLPLLSRLDFSDVNITDPNWLQYLLNLPSLREISLHNCGLIDAMKTSFSINFSSSTPSLYILGLSGNGLTSSTIDRLLNISSSHVALSLRQLDLKSNKLNRLPLSVWQLHKLEKLDVSFNLLEGTITEKNLTNLQNLKYLDLSFNSLILRVDPNWTPPFQLDFINLGGCDVGPHFPLWLRTQSNLESIDLSFAGLKDEVPKWFWDLSVGLYYLNLSHNHLTGIISDFSRRPIFVIDISSNEFSGPIPLFPANTWLIQLSQNIFSGSISSICAFPSPFLYLIDLSNNQLVGELPNCWGNMTGLYYLNLENNSFSGEIPRVLGSCLNS